MQRYLVWDAFVAGARRVDVHPLVLSEALHANAVTAATEVMRFVGQVAWRAHDDAAERACYRVHPYVHQLAAASREGGDLSVVARVDLLLGEDGRWHACEINSDCAGGYNEAFGLPRLARAAGFRTGRNPTRAAEGLVERLASLAQGGGVGLVYATAYAEDLQVCALLQRLLALRGVPALLISATALRLRGGVLTVRSEPIRVLYRYLPTEYMEGQRNLEDIVKAVRSGAVRSVSSFAHVYSQSKLAFARAWAHAPSLDPATRDRLASIVPESFDVVQMAPRRLLVERADWVLKRAYGRVGDQVFVGALSDEGHWRAIVDEVCALSAAGESWVAQRFVPQRAVPTPWGPRYVTLGAYVSDGSFAGYFARVTPKSHVSHDAMCAPVFVEGAS
jgi:glutathionylspermidine synthase